MSDIYRRVKIALLTGWDFEYIDSLGMFDQESILQIYEAEQAIIAAKRGKPKGKKWR